MSTKKKCCNSFFFFECFDIRNITGKKTMDGDKKHFYFYAKSIFKVVDQRVIQNLVLSHTPNGRICFGSFSYKQENYKSFRLFLAMIAHLFWIEKGPDPSEYGWKLTLYLKKSDPSRMSLILITLVGWNLKVKVTSIF